MRIEAVHLISFGKFVNRVINFRDDLQVILGDNEAGKTTLINAISGVLYGFKGRSDEMRKLKARYRPWDHALPYQAGLTLRDSSGNKYYISRNFTDDKTEVMLWKNGSYIPAAMTIEQILNYDLGITKQPLFESTLLIRQEEVSALENKQLDEAITQKITDGGEGFDIRNLFKVMTEKQKELNRGLERPSANPGLIKTASDNLKQIEDEIKALEKFETQYLGQLKELDQKSRREAQVNSILAETIPLLNNYEEKKALEEKAKSISDEQYLLQAKISKIDDKTTQLKKYQEELEELDAVSPYLSEEKLRLLEKYQANLDNLKDNLAKATGKYNSTQWEIEQCRLEKENISNNLAQYYKVKYSQANLQEAQRVIDLLQEYKDVLTGKEKELAGYTDQEEPPKKVRFWLGLGFITVSFFALLLKNTTGLIITIAMILLGILLLSTSRRSNPDNKVNSQIFKILQKEIERLKANINNNERILRGLLGDTDLETFRSQVQEKEKLEQQIQYLDNKIEAIDSTIENEEIEKLQSERSIITQKIKEMIEKAQVEDIESYRVKLKRLQEIKNDNHYNAETLEVLGEGLSLDELKGKLNKLSVDLINIQQKIDLLEIQMDDVEYHKMLKEKEDLVQEKEVLDRELIKLRAQANHFKTNIFQGQDLWTLRDKYAAQVASLEKYQRLNKSIQLATKVMMESLEEAQSSLTPMVQKEVTRIFGQITGKRYRETDVGISNNHLHFKIKEPDKGHFIEPESLSSGTRDQFYLALRVALATYLTGGRNFPLLLDDPFVNFDETRLLNTIEILKELSAERQIIWLSKDRFLQSCPDVGEVEYLN